MRTAPAIRLSRPISGSMSQCSAAAWPGSAPPGSSSRTAAVDLLEPARRLGRQLEDLCTFSALASLSVASAHAARPAHSRAEPGGPSRVRELAAELGIDCDLREQDQLHLHGGRPSSGRRPPRRGRRRRRRPPGCRSRWRHRARCPFEIPAAVRCTGQAEFHPVKYLRGLAEALSSRGTAVHEHTRAVGVAGGRVRTESGSSVRAKHVVLATHIPFLDRGLFFARAGVERSYAISVRLSSPAAGRDAPAG